jgi:hypothetical protein
LGVDAAGQPPAHWKKRIAKTPTGNNLCVILIVIISFLKAKDCAIVDLTNQLDDCKTGGRTRCSVAVQTDKTGDSEGAAIEAYSQQNKFLNDELLEINQLLQESGHREDKLLV